MPLLQELRSNSHTGEVQNKKHPETLMVSGCLLEGVVTFDAA